MIEKILNKDLSIEDRIDSFYDEIDFLVKKGANRNTINNWVDNILNEYYSELPEALSDAIYEFKTSIIGDAAPSSIYRFKGDPENDDELARYVRSNKWMDKSSY